MKKNSNKFSDVLEVVFAICFVSFAGFAIVSGLIGMVVFGFRSFTDYSHLQAREIICSASAEKCWDKEPDAKNQKVIYEFRP